MVYDGDGDDLLTWLVTSRPEIGANRKQDLSYLNLSKSGKQTPCQEFLTLCVPGLSDRTRVPLIFSY